MMHDHWIGEMGWGHLIVALILILVVVVLIKYIFSIEAPLHRTGT